MGQQSSVSSLVKKVLACQKIAGTRIHECGNSTTCGTEKNFVAIHSLKLGVMNNFVKNMKQEEPAFTY